jgi:hypothetical protein
MIYRVITNNSNISNFNNITTDLSNKTNFSNLLVSGTSTLLSSLNTSETTLLVNATTLLSSLNFIGKSNTSGNTSGNNPIINISQNTTWDKANYALYVNGYTFF